MHEAHTQSASYEISFPLWNANAHKLRSSLEIAIVDWPKK
jgi:hypothetical protein